jgi:SAM-dependent methyltransferase
MIGEQVAQPFDYEAKRWGSAPLRPRPWFMNGLKLRYLLSDLANVRGRVLDIGCGAGSVAKAVKRERPDLDVVGCDVSRSALAVAQESPEGVEKPEQVLREVARVLKPGGGFHIVLPLEGQPWTLYRLIGCGTRWTAKVRHGGHIQIFSAERFSGLATFCALPVSASRWSYHFLLQVLDVMYFTWLDWRGPVSGSVEDMAAARPGLVGSLMRGASMAVACLAWGEARLLLELPGGCGHFTCIRGGAEAKV